MFKNQAIAAAVATVVLTAACSGSPSQTSFAPAAAGAQGLVAGQNAIGNGPINTFAAIKPLQNVRHDHRAPWMIKPAVSGNALLYVSDPGTDDVDVYTYQSQRIGNLVGQLTGFNQPRGLCSDGKHVWVANTLNKTVDEYSPGGTAPINVLKVGGYFPVGCAYDATTGNLAVTDFESTSGGAGNIAIFTGAAGRPAYFYSGNVYYYYFDGYDASGNLWFDGQANSAGSPFSFAKLGKNADVGTAVTLDTTINIPGAVQWNGKRLSVGDQETSSGGSTAYEFVMGPAGGTRTHVTPFKDSMDVPQFWIDQRTTAVFGPDVSLAQVGVYKYAVGGMPIQMQSGLTEPFGATIVR